MTKEQYEILLYAQSRIIALLELNNKPKPVPQIPYDDIEEQYKTKIKDETEKIFKSLINRDGAANV